MIYRFIEDLRIHMHFVYTRDCVVTFLYLMVSLLIMQYILLKKSFASLMFYQVILF